MGEYCQHRDPCEKNRCQNGGTCVTQAILGKASCRCPPGFTGEDCQYSTSHPCFVSRPCLNGGTCHMLSHDTYECTCQVGFTGNGCGLSPCVPVLLLLLRSSLSCARSISVPRSSGVIRHDPKQRMEERVCFGPWFQRGGGSIVVRKAWQWAARPGGWLITSQPQIGKSRVGVG